MAIGITARQRADLAAMLPNIEESVTSLKRLITDAKDRTRALQKLDEAEAAQKRHASDVGIPFNSEAFARRRAELNALPKLLTVEEGQLASFSALQRAIGVILEGPYTREGRGSAAERTASVKRPGATKTAAKRGGKGSAPSGAGRKADVRKADGRKADGRKADGRAGKAAGSTSSRSKSATVKRGGTRGAPKPAARPAKAGKAPTRAPGSAGSRAVAPAPGERADQAPARVPMQKPLPLALGS